MYTFLSSCRYTCDFILELVLLKFRIYIKLVLLKFRIYIKLVLLKFRIDIKSKKFPCGYDS